MFREKADLNGGWGGEGSRSESEIATEMSGLLISDRLRRGTERVAWNRRESPSGCGGGGNTLITGGRGFLLHHDHPLPFHLLHQRNIGLSVRSQMVHDQGPFSLPLSLFHPL